MKLTPKTIEILKNFSSINMSIEVRVGNSLRTVRDDQSITARGITDQSFQIPFAIHDLNKFLNVLSLMKNDVDVEFNKSYMVIKSGKQQVAYYYCDPVNIKTKAPKDEFFENAKNLVPMVSFDLAKGVLGPALKAANVLEANEISFVGDGTHIEVRAANLANPLTNHYAVEIAESGVRFSATFNVSSLVCLPSIDYNVRIRPGATVFSGEGYDYLVAMVKKYSNLSDT